MQYLRCKCGKREAWVSGMYPKDCEGCSECNTTFSSTPSGHKEIVPHQYDLIRYNQDTGKPYKMCSVCLNHEPESFEQSKTQ